MKTVCMSGRQAAPLAVAGGECVGWVGADLAGLEGERDGNLVGLATDALLAATEHLEAQIGRILVSDRPLSDGDALGLKFGAGFFSDMWFHGLAAVLVLGADVQYVICGTRSAQALAQD